MIVMASPLTASHLAPNRSNSFPVIGDMIPIKIPPGNSMRPDSIGVEPTDILHIDWHDDHSGEHTHSCDDVDDCR